MWSVSAGGRKVFKQVITKTKQMAVTKSATRIAAEQLCRKFPNSTDNQLARMLYNDYAFSLKDKEAARGIIRVIRGHAGKKHRMELGDKSMMKPLTYDTSIPKMPDSYENDYSPYVLQATRTLIISDLHIPYQNNKAVELAIKYGIDNKANCILINGDLLDFANISRFEKDWRMRTITDEFDATRQFLRYLRHKFPKAKIVFKEGNHDERWEKFLYNKAPEIFDDAEFRLDVRLRFGELGIDHVKDKRPITIGKLWVLHGHELAGGAGGVNPSRSTFLKTNTSCLVGHYHKTSQHTETTMAGEVISVNSVGCLSDLHPHYMPINKFNLGFAFVECSLKSGEYHLHNLKIIKNKVY